MKKGDAISRRTTKLRQAAIGCRVIAEWLEQRRLLSSMAHPGAVVVGQVAPPPPETQSGGFSPLTNGVAPFRPSEIRHFYGIDSIKFNGSAGTGAGETIAIIDAYSQPNIVSDLAAFDSVFGLAAPPSFVVENEEGGSTLPTGYDSDWALETSLDVEWAHAIAPGAKLLLIECDSNAYSDLLETGVATANATPGVAAVSMSFGATDFDGEQYYDPYFAQSGVSYFAGTGDDGSADTLYPSTSPNVVAVGGTAITTSDSSADYSSETVWNDQDGATGGAPSVESQPGYQSSVNPGSSVRTVPDVSFEAAPSTGVYVRDTSQAGGGGYYLVGGTSLATPCWAALVAIADQGRALNGLPALSGSSQTLPRLYQLPAAVFHDITTGNNNFDSTGGYNASTGYDLASGIGTPIANTLVTDLAGGASVSGSVFIDTNSDGILNGTDTPLAGQSVYLDLNNDGIHEANEPTTVTNSQGLYSINQLVTGGDLLGGLSGTVRLMTVPAGYAVVGTHAGFSTAYATVSTANVGLFPTAYVDSNANQAYAVRVSPTQSTQLQILHNGAVADTAPVGLANSLSFSLTGDGDSLSVDFSNGNPIPIGGLTLNGSSGSSNVALSIIGSAGNDAISINAHSVTVGSSTINDANVSQLSVDPGAGIDSLTVAGTSATIPAGAVGGGHLVRRFSTLAVGASASLMVTASAPADRAVLVVSTLSVASGSKLDLTDNDMDISSTSLAAVAGLAATGYANGLWNGPGLASATAAADSSHLTALAVIGNNQSGTALFSATNPFDGVVPGSADVLVKYTYYGDANLDGAVDGTDYSRIDNGSLSHLTGWTNGDFNYDNVIDGSDYTLIDDDYNTQGAKIAASIAPAPAANAARVARFSNVAISSQTASTIAATDWQPADRKKSELLFDW